MKKNSRNSVLTALLLANLCAVTQILAQGTVFTYQGRLDLNGSPVSGSYDLRFTVYDALTSGSIAGGPLTNSSVNVSNGLFATSLDFGAGVFTGAARWLQIEVRTNGGGGFALLAHRQPIAATPYAIHAANASNVVNGAVVKSLNSLRDNVTIVAGANVTLATNGNTLTVSSTGPAGAIWSLSGANTYYNAGNVGIGITSPNHRLRISGGPAWTGHAWGGAMELDNASAIAWNGNAVGSRFGIGQTTAGLYFFSSSVDNPGTGSIPPDYRLLIGNSGNVGIGTPFGQAPSSKLTVVTPFLSSGVEHTDGNVRLSTYIDATGGWLGTLSNHKLHFYVNNSSPKMTVDTSGYVGVGTTSPQAKFHLYDASLSSTALRIETGSGVNAFARTEYANLNGQWNVGTSRGFNGDQFYVHRQGSADIAFAVQPNGDMKGTRLVLRADPGAPANAAVLCEDPNVANFVPYNTANNRPLNIIARDAVVRQLTITGGADLAEPFKMSSDSIPKGAVVVIDEDKPGHLELSTEAYDRRVAGVVSGANGVRPGISLHQEGEIEGGENVALSGRVYVQADATVGMIKPGDLLTTSDAPGYAMKVTDHARAQGATLGKAMTGLKEGKGMVLVLVTLQ